MRNISAAQERRFRELVMQGSLAGEIDVSFERLRKVYPGGIEAVKDLTLKIKRGEFFGLLGPNGAGKTTTIGVIAGLVQPTSGRVLVRGLDAVREYRRVHRLVGVMPQEEALDSWFLNVREILIYNAGYFGIAPREAKRRADELLKRFDLWEKRKSQVNELSGGMKRRLMLAKALIHDPEILILDEPTAGADVALRRQLWELMRELNSQGKTILLTTHYLEEAEELCERVAILDRGELIAVGPPEELTRRVGQDVVEIELDASRWPEGLRLEIEHALSDGRLTLPGTLEDPEVLEALSRLAKAGVKIEAIRARRARLEDVFMELTRGLKS
jgi:ABC-2 type transport system ATP-binding protein